MTEAETGRRGDIALFLIVTFAFTWAFWVPSGLMGQGWQPPGFVHWWVEGPLNHAAFGPTVGALAVMFRRGGIARAIQFLWQGLTQPFRIWLIIPALGLFPLITGIALAIGAGPAALTTANPNFDSVGTFLLAFAMMFLTGGPLQEEFGWRGFLQPALQQRVSGLTAALIVGVIWAIWHFPLNFEEVGRGPQYSQVLSILIGSIITITLTAIIFAWLYNASSGSVLLVMLLHASMNFSFGILFRVFENQTSLAIYTGLILLAAITAILVGGPRGLGRDVG